MSGHDEHSLVVLAVFNTYFYATLAALGVGLLFVSSKPVTFGSISLSVCVAAAVAKLLEKQDSGLSGEGLVGALNESLSQALHAMRAINWQSLASHAWSSGHLVVGWMRGTETGAGGSEGT